MGILLSAIINFFLDIIRDLAKDKSKDYIESSIKEKRRWQLLSSPKKIYFKQLIGVLKEMPFIYKDIELEVMSDFQDIRAIPVITEGLEIKIDSRSENDSKRIFENDFFSEYTKVLLLGNAGMGKSTFLRYIVLSIIQNKKNVYLRNFRDVIPILLPLKAIQNHKKSPILDFIFSEVSIFKGPKGRNRFLKEVNKKTILLLLDGYDELGFIQKENYAQYEINILLSTRFEKIDDSKINSEFTTYYKALCYCKTCLSSREEFYRTYALKSITNPHTNSIQSLGDILKDFIALKILGLESNRVDFAKSIFNRYRTRSRMFDDNLDEELFVSNIDNSHDLELIKFSKIPLFLTIMCYIYAEKIKQDPSIFSDVWVS